VRKRKEKVSKKVDHLTNPGDDRQDHLTKIRAMTAIRSYKYE